MLSQNAVNIIIPKVINFIIEKTANNNFAGL